MINSQLAVHYLDFFSVGLCQKSLMAGAIFMVFQQSLSCSRDKVETSINPLSYLKRLVIPFIYKYLLSLKSSECLSMGLYFRCFIVTPLQFNF